MPGFVLTAFVLACLSFLIFMAPADAKEGLGTPAIDFGTLLGEMYDLEGMARIPEVPFSTKQFSSYDRRSTSPEAPDWYANADGFGDEPIPGFEKVLEEPGEDGVGLYLMAMVEGPGAIVRGWSAGMGGRLEVYLDGAEDPVFQGPAYDFLARRSQIFFEGAGLSVDCKDAFCQQDADYLPIPFAKSLRVIWKGKLRELHFYHLEVRLYEDHIQVKTFDPMKDPVSFEKIIRDAVEGLTRPETLSRGEVFEEQANLDPHGTWTWDTPSKDRAGAITEFSLRFEAADVNKALRGTLLRIAFDGAHKPQVDAPAGDFFGSGPAVNLINSLPMTVAADGTMTCRFVMPFEEGARVTLCNSTDAPVKMNASIRVSPWSWDDRSLYFRAKWRTTNQIDLKNGPFDMPYILVRGKGRFVGAACMLVNPSPIPHPYGSWWGEGDEKIFIDDEPFPSFFGTGSEDYYNYSWSRPDLFDHPYCGQPLDMGPGNQGYCSNHRWHILDSILFQRALAFYMEVWHHSIREGFCYSCIGYHYARPGAIDDHRRVQLSELVVPELRGMEPEPTYGSHDAIFLHFEDMEIEVEGGANGFDQDIPTASRGRLLFWKAKPGDRFRAKFKVEKDRDVHLNMVASHRPNGGAIRVLMDGNPLKSERLGGAELGSRGDEKIVLRSRHALRLLSTSFKKHAMKAGEHDLEFECIEPGRFGFDYLWVR